MILRQNMLMCAHGKWKEKMLDRYFPTEENPLYTWNVTEKDGKTYRKRHRRQDISIAGRSEEGVMLEDRQPTSSSRKQVSRRKKIHAW